MKKICIIFLAFAIIVLSVLSTVNGSFKGVSHEEYLRIHIRADSNSEEDQAVKYLIKEEVVNFLTPYIAQCKTKKDAEDLLNQKLGDIENVCDKVLYKEGFSYSSRAKINNEKFPTRVYGELTLENGFYDALIIELGSGKGDNWWCVVYPPLCFMDGNLKYEYKSKIYEIINSFINSKKEK